MEFQDKIAIITGASSGIGKAIATALSENECTVILASRSIEKLKDIQSKLPHESMAVEMDVSDSQSVSQAFKNIKDKYSRIDILVNAADMKRQKSGHIINITSVDGKELYQGGAVYGASKAALIALSRAMRMELSPEFNIRVASIEPGTVDTNLRDDITDKELLEDKDYGGVEAKLQPEDIAQAVLYVLNQPATVNVNELLIKPTGKP